MTDIQKVPIVTPETEGVWLGPNRLLLDPEARIHLRGAALAAVDFLSGQSDVPAVLGLLNEILDVEAQVPTHDLVYANDDPVAVSAERRDAAQRHVREETRDYIEEAIVSTEYSSAGVIEAAITRLVTQYSLDTCVVRDGKRRTMLNSRGRADLAEVFPVPEPDTVEDTLSQEPEVPTPRTVAGWMIGEKR